MTHGSLFSGIGGFDLAAELAGCTNVFHCEYNPFCQKVLKYYWPDADSYGDIHEFDGSKYYGTVDIISGGFPCQPFSMAGKRKGNEDDRHLWPEMLRVIKQIAPAWVVGENVYGLVNWEGGLVFHEIISDLESAGYEVQCYVIPACAVDAPHRRDRLWIVAHTKGLRGNRTEKYENGGGQSGERGRCDINNDGEVWRVASDTKGKRQPSQSTRSEEFRSQTESGLYGGGSNEHESSSDTEAKRLERGRFQFRPSVKIHSKTKIPDWSNFPTQPPVCQRNDGLSAKLDGITFSKHRIESIKAYGNAIVPSIAYQIFKAINEYELINNNNYDKH